MYVYTRFRAMHTPLYCPVGCIPLGSAAAVKVVGIPRLLVLFEPVVVKLTNGVTIELQRACLFRGGL